MNDMTGKPKEIGKALAPLERKTRGEQEQGEAIPVGEGRYAIFERHDSTRLAYRLSSPESPGKAQRELGMHAGQLHHLGTQPRPRRAGFRCQPELSQAPAGQVRREALDRYRRRQASRLRERPVPADRGDALSEEDITLGGKPGKTLGLKKRDWPTEALEAGKLAAPQMEPEAHEPAGDPAAAANAAARRRVALRRRRCRPCAQGHGFPVQQGRPDQAGPGQPCQ